MKMHKTITIFEYKSSKKLKKYIPDLNKINKIYSKNNNKNKYIFNIIGNEVFGTKYVGFLQIKNQPIQILPKIIGYNTNKSNEYSNIIKNLLFMLKYTNKLDIKESDITNIKKNQDLFEIMIYIFSKKLLELLKFNLYKNYEIKEDNIKFLKGKLKFKEHINKNFINKANFYCEYDEFIEDNLLNQIFKKTIVKLLKITKSNNNYKLLNTCNLILNKVSIKKISPSNIQKIKFNRFNESYKSCFNLAKLLLFGNSTELSYGNITTFSFLFDMNQLFEEFIREFIKKEISYSLNIDVDNRVNNRKVFDKTNKLKNYNLKPDIILKNKNNQKIKLIIDTKYKLLIKKDNKLDISSSDIYQMFIYGMKLGEYFEDTQKKIILLYPEPFDNESNINKTNIFGEINRNKENLLIKIKTVNLKINLIKNKNKLKEELENIIKN